MDFLDDEGAVVEAVRVADADLDGIPQKYAGDQDALEAGSNYVMLSDNLDEKSDVTLANPAKTDWLDGRKQKNDRKDAKYPARFLRTGEVSESFRR